MTHDNPNGDGNIFNKCQLVVLDTLVHKSQQFILKKPLQLSFNG